MPVIDTLIKGLFYIKKIMESSHIIILMAVGNTVNIFFFNNDNNIDKFK